MDKFCGLCGAQLDEKTGRCPNPDCKSNEGFVKDSGQIYTGENGTFEEDYAPVTAKKRGAMIAVCIVAGVLLILGGFFALCYFDVLNIGPVNSAFVSLGIKDENETTEAETESESDPQKESDRSDAEISDVLSLVGRDIEKAAREIGNMKDERCTDGITGYTNGSLIIETAENSRKVSYVCITGNSKYRLAGISLGNDIEDAQRILESSRYTLKNENSSGFRRFVNEAGDVICVMCSKDMIEEISYSKSQKKPEASTTAAQAAESSTTYAQVTADSKDYSDVTEDVIPTESPYTGTILSTGDFDSCTVSSVLAPQEVNGNKFSYGGENLIDNNPNTCWAEGVNGAGVGENIRLECNEQTEMSGLIINNGYCKSEKLYNYNNRLKDIRIIFDDGSEMKTRLKDGYSDRNIIVNFGSVKETRFITVIIDSVYDGKDCNDTCVSDIRYFVGN